MLNFACAIARLRGTVDVRRQRCLPGLVEIPPQVVPFEGKPDRHLAIADGGDLDPRAVRFDDRAGPQRLRRASQGEPVPASERLDEQKLHLSARPFLVTAKPRRNHLGVVDDEEVALAQQIGEVADGSVRGRPLCPGKHEEPRGVALGERGLGDELLGQLVVERRDVHR